jgi:hypothetical protein
MSDQQSLADDCRDLIRHALHCIHLAERVDARSRTDLIQIADGWLKLAGETLTDLEGGTKPQLKPVGPDIEDSFYLRAMSIRH